MPPPVKSDYSKKLSDPRWQKLRAEVLKRDGFRCCTCEDSSSELHVHHHFYIFGLDPWEYPADTLETLCFRCHEWATQMHKRLRASLCNVRTEDLSRIIGYIEAVAISWFRKHKDGLFRMAHPMDMDWVRGVGDHLFSHGGEFSCPGTSPYKRIVEALGDHEYLYFEELERLEMEQSACRENVEE
jgi:hypothetical protein